MARRWADGLHEEREVTDGVSHVCIVNGAEEEPRGAAWAKSLLRQEVGPEHIEGDRQCRVVAEGHPSLGDVLQADWPVPGNVDEVVGVLLLAPVPERDGLEDDEGSGAADANGALGLVPVERGSGDLAGLCVIEGEAEAERTEGGEVLGEVERAPPIVAVGLRFVDEEVDNDGVLRAGVAPTLLGGVATFVGVGFEAPVSEALGELVVAVLIDDGESDAEVDIDGADVGLVAGRRPRPDR